MATIAQTISELYDAEPPTSTPTQDAQPSGVAWRNYNTAPTTLTPPAAATVSFDQALLQATARAKDAYPEEHVRIERGLQIAIVGDVTLLADGTALVQSQSQTDATYRVNGHCACQDATYRAPAGRCQHRWAKSLVKWAQHAATAPPAAPVERRCPSCLIMQAFPGACCEFCTALPAVLGEQEPETPVLAPEIAPEHIVEIQGKRFVKYAGLLALAHARGLSSLTAAWTFNDGALSLAHAVAVFPFGRFEESGDATPDNVTKKVAPHFRRVALTRAKARVLRDALNVDMVALEELSE